MPRKSDEQGWSSYLVGAQIRASIPLIKYKGVWIENDYCQSYSDTFKGIKSEKYTERNNFLERIATS